jgi:hypothetical protein
MVFLTVGFGLVPELLSLRLPLKTLEFEPFLRKTCTKIAEPRVRRGGTDPLFFFKKGPAPTYNADQYVIF